MLNKELEKIDMSPIRRMFEKAASLKEPINLSIGIPHADASEALKRRVCEAIENGNNAYTPTKGRPELIEAVKAEKPSGDVIITAGAAGALDLALRTILNPGDEVIVPDPYFVAYTAIPPLCGAKVRLLDTYPDFRIDEEKLKQLVNDKTKAIIINTPHNPTGRVYTREEIKTIAEIAKENDLLVISDEVYENYVYEGEHISIGEMHENTITIGSFSKSHAVTGWRVGYAVGPESIINEMCKLQQFTYVCANSAAQAAVAKEKADVPLHLYDTNRKLLKQELGVSSQGAFYAFLPVPKGDKRFVDAALEKNLLVVPGSAFSQKSSHVRVSFATDTNTLKRGIAIIKELIASM
ncbi:MAG: pyridoxal phosphate-dependent aminotransferase [Candidatus Woesearchaeota archaeon]